MKPKAGRVVTVGEIMLRLAPPGFERFLQTPQFVATFGGGGEANVAVALASLGVPAAFVTVLPDKNPIADAAIAELAKLGVDTSYRARERAHGRLLSGSRRQPKASKVVYDRDGSSIALAQPGVIDWAGLTGRGWFHLTGITPAISASAKPGASPKRLSSLIRRIDHLHRPELSQELMEVGKPASGSDAGDWASSLRTSSSPTKKTFR